MYLKKKQKSRLNSLADISWKSKESLANVKKDKKPLILEEKSIDSEDISYDYEGCEETLLEESLEKLERPLTRTELLILDYRQFKAARSIQRFVRGWLYRQRYVRLRKAAIIIQREWRRFYCQRKYFIKMEEAMQQRIEQHYYRAAQKIQALWRGWWVRHHVHDHTRLMCMQLMAGEDLLYCVAFKLHHLLRTHQIPGVYSLRNSNALSKIEQLLASLSFKACNHRIFQTRLQRRYEIEEAKKQHKKSTFGTKLPFVGPDISNVCEPQCQPLYTQKNADVRMARILQMYEEANRELKKPKACRKKFKGYYTQQYLNCLTKSSSFCTDVVKSMKKWKVITENNVTIDPNIFKKPQILENFLKEIESMINVLQGNCYCRPAFDKELEEQKEKLIKGEEAKCSISSGTSAVNTSNIREASTVSVEPTFGSEYLGSMIEESPTTESIITSNNKRVTITNGGSEGVNTCGCLKKFLPTEF